MRMLHFETPDRVIQYRAANTGALQHDASNLNMSHNEKVYYPHPSFRFINYFQRVETGLPHLYTGPETLQ